MKNKLTLNLLAIFVCSLLCSGIEIDFSSGGYSIKNEERNGKERYERRSSDEIYSKKRQAKEDYERRINEPIHQSGPPPAWKKVVVYDGGIITNDFINTTSNRLVITVLDYAKAKRNGISDLQSIFANYQLNLMLLPGDKYHLMNDGGNGVRMEKYLQAHKFSDDMTKKNTNYNRVLKDEYKKHTVTNVIIKTEEYSKNLTIVPAAGDIDSDGITTHVEILGRRGFVTDPTNSDTDNDGIPDKHDKEPLTKCKSENPEQMPVEWCKYRCKGKNENINLLLPAKSDPDNDGIINEYEKILYTDPLKEDGKIICFPDQPVFEHQQDDTYVAYLNVYVNYDEPVTLIVLSFNQHYNIPEDTPSISYVSSTPLGWEPSIFKGLFHERRFLKKYYRLVADVQPKTIHTFAITDKGHKIRFSKTIEVFAYSREQERKAYDNTSLGHRWIRAWRLEDYSPWPDPDYWPTPPESAFPKADYIYKDYSKIVFRHEPFPERNKGWHTDTNDIIQIGVNACSPTSIDKYDVVPKPLQLVDNGFEKSKTKIISYKYFDPYFGVHCINSKYFPIFKEERVDENSEFVFKGKTVREIKEELNRRMGREVEIIEEGD